MAVIHEPKKKNVPSVAPHGCPERNWSRWPRDGDSDMTPGWLDWRVWLWAIVVMIALGFFVVPWLLDRWIG